MATIHLLTEFKKFLRLFNCHGVEYLLVGGHAVGIHGYVRATNDLDVWVKAKWPLGRVALFFLLSLVPFGGLYGDKLLKKYEADGVIAARARREGTVSA